MVGMTGMPEATLAKEIGLCYAAIAVVANYAAGRGDSAGGIAMDEINAVLQEALAKVQAGGGKTGDRRWRLGKCCEWATRACSNARARSTRSIRRTLHALLADMQDTMQAQNGAGLAAPQIGVGLQVVIFGVDHNPRYPDAEAVPDTVLINPVLTPLDDEMEDGWEGCLSVPGMRGVVPRFKRLRYRGYDQFGRPIDRSRRRLSCARCAARMRPSDRRAVPDAHPRFQPIRLYRNAVPRGRRRGRLSSGIQNRGIRIE